MIFRRLICSCGHEFEAQLGSDVRDGQLLCPGCGNMIQMSSTQVSAWSRNGAHWQAIRPPEPWYPTPPEPSRNLVNTDLFGRPVRIIAAGKPDDLAIITDIDVGDKDIYDQFVSGTPSDDAAQRQLPGPTDNVVHNAEVFREEPCCAEMLPVVIDTHGPQALCRCSACGQIRSADTVVAIAGRWWLRALQARERQVTGAMPEIQGKVIGYRAWDYDLDTGLLEGAGLSVEWNHGVNTATCNYGCALSPAEECKGGNPGCGMYGLAHFDKENRWWFGGELDGAIRAWGDPFMVHDDVGFRARYAEVVLLAVEPDWPRPKRDLVRAYAAEYRADTCNEAHLEDAAKEHGQLIPEDILTWSKTTSEDGLDKMILERWVTGDIAASIVGEVLGIEVAPAARD